MNLRLKGNQRESYITYATRHAQDINRLTVKLTGKHVKDITADNENIFLYVYQII